MPLPAARRRRRRLLLGELQLAFVLFAFLSSHAALQQWKALLSLAASAPHSAEEGAITAPLLDTLREQARLASRATAAGGC